MEPQNTKIARQMFAPIFRELRSASLDRRRLGPALWAVAVALVCGPVMYAHEIGTTRVSVTFQKGRTYEVELVTDATSLAEKIEASAGRSPQAGMASAALESSLRDLDERFRARVKIAFDASDVRPVIAYSVAPGSGASPAAVATIRLSGEVPRD